MPWKYTQDLFLFKDNGTKYMYYMIPLSFLKKIYTNLYI